ncbi:MAG: ribbon-helix-helix domain-containing protein [Candidatus Njordarchaeota archaeon]
MRVVSIRIPENIIHLIDLLCEKGYFVSRTEFIRYAIRIALEKFRKEIRQDAQKILSSVPISWNQPKEKETYI